MLILRHTSASIVGLHAEILFEIVAALSALRQLMMEVWRLLKRVF